METMTRLTVARRRGEGVILTAGEEQHIVRIPLNGDPTLLDILPKGSMSGRKLRTNKGLVSFTVKGGGQQVKLTIYAPREISISRT